MPRHAGPAWVGPSDAACRRGCVQRLMRLTFGRSGISMSVQRGFWLAVTCGALILTLATGLRATFGLFLKPISLDLGMSRELFGFGIALQNLLWGAASPFFGGLA